MYSETSERNWKLYAFPLLLHSFLKCFCLQIPHSHTHMCTNKTRQELLWPALLHYQLVCVHIDDLCRSLKCHCAYWNDLLPFMTLLETLVKKLQWNVMNDDVKFRCSKEHVGWIGFIACILWFLFIYLFLIHSINSWKVEKATGYRINQYQ